MNVFLIALPPLDAATIPLYLGALYGVWKGLKELHDFILSLKKERRDEITHATEDARLSREEAVQLTEIQDKTIARLKDELVAAEVKARDALTGKQTAEAKAEAAEAKLTTAARQWFERQGFVDDLERRVAELEGRH